MANLDNAPFAGVIAEHQEEVAALEAVMTTLVGGRSTCPCDALTTPGAIALQRVLDNHRRVLRTLQALQGCAVVVLDELGNPQADEKREAVQ